MQEISKCLFLFVGFFIATFSIYALTTTAVPITPRIIGGDPAPIGKYPYMASLRIGSKHFCGGSILNSRWILTAAHCIDGPRFQADRIHVVVGTNRLDDISESIWYQSDLLVSHPEYNLLELKNDIGMIHVNKDIAFNHNVQHIKLPTKDISKDCFPAKFTGWGKWNFLSDRLPIRLQELKLKVLGESMCKRQIPVLIDKSHICTYTRMGQGICNGDSGSPLIADGVQIGIASFGAMPCGRGIPDVFARVYTFVEWIEKVEKSH